MSRRTWAIIRFAVAIAIIFFLVTKINVTDVVNSILSAKLHYVIPSIILNLLAWYIASYMLKFISDIEKLSISTFQAVEITLSTLFYSLFLPAGNLAGGLIKFYKLSRNENKLTGAFVTVALDRVFGTVGLCIVGLFFWMISFPDDTSLFVLSMVILLLGLSCFCALIFFNRGQRITNWLLGLANKVYFSPKLNKFISSLSELGKVPFSSLILLVVASIVMHLINVVVFYSLLLSLDLDVSFVTVGWIRSVVIMITIIPITISGLGLREGAFILLLGAFGVSDSNAFAYSLLIFAVTQVLPGLLGGLFEARTLIAKGYTQ